VPDSDPTVAGHTGPRLAKRLDALSGSGIRRFFDIMASMEDVISLSIGEPDFVTPGPMRDAAIRSIEKGHTHYTSNYGLIELREQLARHLDHLYGLQYEPSNELLITSGVSEALDVTIRAIVDPGDEVILPDPSYVAYSPAISLAGGTPVPVRTTVEDGFALSLASVADAVTDKTRAILLGFPANPTGAVMPLEALSRIAQLAVDCDLIVISDEIYDRLVYGVEHVPIATLPGMHERTFTLGGFSKDYAMTGWRVGYIGAPAPLLEGAMKIHQYVMMSAPTAAQWGALEALTSGEEHVVAMRDEYDRRRRLMVDGFNAMGLSCVEPHGAFYAFPSVAASGLDDETFAERLLLEERVALVPGSAFGEGGRGYVRACYATAYGDIERALERISRFLQSGATAK
jgi:aminotransferase